jgi:prephenate dehydratase
MTRLAYLGPPGTFSEEAALRYDPQGPHLPLPSISAVAAAVATGMAEAGVVPIENSLEGSVPETLDVLVHQSDLLVRSELVLPIEHHLLVPPGVEASQVKVIFSHPQALAQCRRFIERCFPRAELVAALSTAAAVEEALARQDAAAIGTRRAAQLYGAQVLAEAIHDRRPNLTRFLLLARQDHPPTGRDKTSLAFTFATEDRPGLLVGALTEFSSRGINLSKIESRPTGDRLGTYIFLVDVDGHRQEPPLAEALEAVRRQCSFFRILGSYPKWQP